MNLFAVKRIEHFVYNAQKHRCERFMLAQRAFKLKHCVKINLFGRDVGEAFVKRILRRFDDLAINGFLCFDLSCRPCIS